MLRCISFFSFIKRILILCILLYRENGHQPPVGGGLRWEAAKHLELQGCCAVGICGTWGLLALVCKHAASTIPWQSWAAAAHPSATALCCSRAHPIPVLHPLAPPNGAGAVGADRDGLSIKLLRARREE